MKIAQIDVNYNFSSTGKIVADLDSAFADAGHITRVYFGRGINPNKSNIVKISNNFEVLLHVFMTRITGVVDYFSPLASKRLIAHLDEFKPDIVHLHDLHGYFLNIYPLAEYLKANRISTVWTFHCEFMYTGKCGNAFNCEKWKSECDHCPDLNGYPRSLVFDFTNRMFHQKIRLFEGFDFLHLVAPSEWLAKRMRMSIVRDKNISTVRNGVDLSTFAPSDSIEIRKALGINDNFVALSVGSSLLSESKGGKWILELANRNLHSGIVFVMVGVDHIPSQIPANVRMIPRIRDQKLLAKYYSLGDVLVLTSSSETFSMVCAESLACGTPVIGFDSGAPKEVALPGFGEFVPYADLDALESLLFRVKTGELRLNSRSSCVQFAASRYSKTKMVESYMDIYEQLLMRRNHGIV